MKVLDNSKPQSTGSIPVITAVPVENRRPEAARADVLPVRPSISKLESAALTFLRQFRVLLGAARLYQRNHPRLIENLASAEQQLRIALSFQCPLVIAVERHGIILPQLERSDLLHDPRGELTALAEELLRSGICSLLFSPPINVGHLDLLAHEITRVPRTASPGDTASRQLWENWLKDRKIPGIRINVPTERRDSLLMASLTSAILAYDDASKHSGGTTKGFPEANFDAVAATVRLLEKLKLPEDPEMRPATDDLARRFHSIVSNAQPSSTALLVHLVSSTKPREGESLDPYLDRLADALVLGFVRQEFDAGRIAPQEITAELVRLDRERGQPQAAPGPRLSTSQYDEVRVASLCEKLWTALPARIRAKILLSSNAWCVPAPVISRFLDPLAAASEKKKSDASGREGRAVLLAYARCLASEESRARRAVATGLAEIAGQIERLWPHPLAFDFGPGIVQALLRETSPGIAGLLSAAVENLARISLSKREYAEFERILEALEAAPRDEEHAHISTLVARILGDEQWFYLVDDALSNQPLHPVIPRLVRRCPDRLLDRFSLLLTAPNGLDLVPAMVRLIHAAGEPVLGALETRLYEARRQRAATAITLLASADPKRLATALPRALASWDWSLQDLAATELMKWTNPPVVAASAQAFLATLAEAHSMVVPCMIDHLGSAREAAAIPTLLQIAAGEHLTLRDVFFRIKAVEALGRMSVAEAAVMLRRIARERNGISHAEPAALRSSAQEVLALLENRTGSARARGGENSDSKTGAAYSRARRYPRVRPGAPLQAVITGARTGAAKVRVLALGGAFLETEQHLVVGDSLRLEIRTGMRKVESTAVVRSISPAGAGVEFVHMKPTDRERLRNFVSQLLA